MIALIRGGGYLLALGLFSFIASLVASGLEYRRAEAAGSMPGPTSEWILYWHGLSLLVLLLGVVLLCVGFIRRRRASGPTPATPRAANRPE
ncbi:hypothetical protein Clow_00174 [Corynebacterium lowii]|uniref:Uncharacterized protein n=1 Tax=Corynebacterium lowii TaxID=1544413 RepID=A0A0Q0ULC4_9CORY|nr:hypothetical protein Clow_00174 [Corynebacterium lowii]MDP9852288.1 hypothetical protein [Corynebacterium lowii]